MFCVGAGALVRWGVKSKGAKNYHAYLTEPCYATYSYSPSS